MKATELLKRIESKDAPVIIDARTGIEFRRGHVPGAINAPPRKILLRTARLPRDKECELVVYCEHGQRAWVAKKLLAARGYCNTKLLEGSLMGWKKAGRPLEK
ncbi:MAG TPA: rhodanese-like domain-containing protein [Phycisphaerae bacterium]|nr:rhodanese-like domain-containing protein [Phycisphaerae bacterium]